MESDSSSPASQKPSLQEDVFNLFPKLQVGLDVDVRFDHIRSFEPTPDMCLFDAFDVRLVHGWTVDPQDTETYRIVVEQCAHYNKLAEFVIAAHEEAAANNAKKATSSNAIQDTERSESNTLEGMSVSSLPKPTSVECSHLNLCQDILPKTFWILRHHN